MNFVDQIRLWSHQQQKLGKASKTALTALNDVVAVYSAHPSAPLSLFARTKNFDAKKFRALEVDKMAVRLGAMRGSIHLMPRQTAPLISAATVGQDAKMLARRMQVAGFTPQEYHAFKKVALKKVKEPITVRALREMPGEAERDWSHILRAMSDELLVMRIGAEGLRSNELKYVLIKAWLGEDIPREDKDKALTWLAGEYLRAFGPVRVQDFMWWINTTKTVATRVFANIETVDVGGGYLLLKEHQKAFEKVKPFAKDVIDLTPKWDAYQMGYPADGRERFVTKDMQHHLYDLVGDGVGAILMNGLAVGAWDLRTAKEVLDVNVDWFEKPTAKLKQAVITELEAVAVFLEAKSIKYSHLGDELEGRTLGRMR